MKFADEPIAPVTCLVGDGRSELIEALLPSAGSVFVGVLDGAAMRNEEEVYYRFWDEFRFPEYFGWNWDALRDCLRDLNWISADSYYLIITNADDLLSDDRDRRPVFFDILNAVIRKWSNGGDDRIQEEFKVIFICEDGREMADCLASSGVPVRVVRPS